jgi:hypothetical protein
MVEINMKPQTVEALLRRLQKAPLRLALIATYLKILEGKTITSEEFEETIDLLMEVQEKIKNLI